MKKIVVFVFSFLILNVLHSLGTLHVKSVKELPATHTNLSVYDADGKFAPVLIIITELKGLGIQNIGRPTKHAPEYMAGDHQYKFYMNDSQRVVKITHADYEPLEVRLLADFGIDVKAQRVYELVLDNTPEKEFINVAIISDPADALKIIDGKDMGTGQSFELFIGIHTLKLQKNGFKSLTQDIEVSKNNTLFNNLELAEVEPVMITIKSEPNEADIYINNVNEGKTNKQLFKFPDTYDIRITKAGFDIIEDRLIIDENSNNTFNFKLTKNAANLSIKTIPPDCEILINNEKINGNSKDLAPGRYKITIRSNRYYEENRTIDIEKGINVIEEFILKPKTGKLQFVIEPMEAQVALKLENNIIDTWTGSKFFSSIVIGEYQLTATCRGYKSRTKPIKVELDKTCQIEMVLSEGEDIALSDAAVNSLEDMVLVYGGSFTMGHKDWKPIREVTLNDFYLCKHEVTQQEWLKYMGYNQSDTIGNNLPIEAVSWYAAVTYCNRRSISEGLTPCYTKSGESYLCDFQANGYRLPTEAEWEFAARGGNYRRSLQSTQDNPLQDYKFAGSDTVLEVAWYEVKSKGKMHPICTKQPNELGLYDMCGNVMEWCWDWHKKYPKEDQTNPIGPETGKNKVLRGGHYDDWAKYSTVYCRDYLKPKIRLGGRGFRVARTP